MNKLRYINLGKIEPEFLPACWECSRLIDLKKPTLFVFSISKTTIARAGKKQLNEVVKINEIPKDLEITRIDGNDSGGYILTPETMCFYMHSPVLISRNESDKAMQVAVLKGLKQHNVQIERQVNDLYFLDKGKRKKFSGTMHCYFSKGWTTFGISVSFKFDSKLGNKIFRFDNEKFAKKGNIKDIDDIVGGLLEVVPKIEIDKVSKTIVQKIAERFNLEVEESSLTRDELLKMNELADKLNNKDWKLYGKRNNI